MNFSKNVETNQQKNIDVVEINNMTIDDCDLEQTRFRVSSGECYYKNQFNILGNEFISDDVIKFYGSYLIRKAEENGVNCGFLGNTFYELFCANLSFSIPLDLQNSSLWFMPINYANSHWRLLIVVCACDSEKPTRAFLLDSLLLSKCDPREALHCQNMMNEWEKTDTLEIECIEEYTNFIIQKFDANHEPVKIEILECVKQEGNDCGLCVLKNIENAIIHHDDFINVNENNAFLTQIKEWYLSSEAHDLRQQLVTLITDIDLNYKMTLN